MQAGGNKHGDLVGPWRVFAALGVAAGPGNFVKVLSWVGSVHGAVFVLVGRCAAAETASKVTSVRTGVAVWGR
jgi:hypothetical protein